MAVAAIRQFESFIENDSRASKSFGSEPRSIVVHLIHQSCRMQNHMVLSQWKGGMSFLP
jgi:hypothetical protein